MLLFSLRSTLWFVCFFFYLTLYGMLHPQFECTTRMNESVWRRICFLLSQSRDMFLLLQVEPPHRCAAGGSGPYQSGCRGVWNNWSALTGAPIFFPLFLHRCVFPLCPPALPVPLSPAEACRVQRAAAALLPACGLSGTSTWCHADRAGQSASVWRGFQTSNGGIEVLLQEFEQIKEKKIWQKIL